MSSENVKIEKFKILIENLKRKKGFHTELISLFIPHDRKLSDVRSYLKNELNESQHIKSKSTRKNVLASISSLLGALARSWTISKNGLALFSGAIPQNNVRGSEKNETFIIEPPEKIYRFQYYCSSEFHLDPLEEMVIPKETYGLIVVGRKRAIFGYIRGKHLKILKEFTSRVPGKSQPGGQSQMRYARFREIGEVEFYRKISSDINKFFLSMNDLSGIFIGGAGHSKLKFIDKAYLDYRLRPKIIDVVDLGYDGGYEAIRALVNKVRDQIKNVSYVREINVMERFLKEISIDSGKALYGNKEVKKALQLGAVEVLIISEKYEQKEKLWNLAEEKGTRVEIISLEIETGEALYKTFGGIVAILRYELEL